MCRRSEWRGPQHVHPVLSLKNQHSQQARGVNQRSKNVTQTQQQWPDSPAVAFTWHACKYKVDQLQQRYILNKGCLHLPFSLQWCLFTLHFHHWRELPQVSFLSRQKFCRDKHVFVATKHAFYRDKSTVASTKLLYFVATNKLSLQKKKSRQKACFVATNMCLSQQKLYLWQLPPMMHFRHNRRHRCVQRKTELIFIQAWTWSFDLETGWRYWHTYIIIRFEERIRLELNQYDQ